MKIVLTLFLIICIADLCEAQGMPLKDGKIVYELIDSTAAPKDELYDRVKRILPEYFTTIKDQMELDNKETGEIVLKSTVKITDRQYMPFTFSIRLKDNKFRLQVYDIKKQSYTGYDGWEVENMEAAYIKFKETKKPTKWDKTYFDYVCGVFPAMLKQISSKMKEKKDDF